MKMSIIVKDFKYKNLYKNVNLISQYDKCFRVKLMNYVFKELIKFIILLPSTVFKMHSKNIQYLKTRLYWSDILNFNSSIDINNYVLDKKDYFFNTIQIYNLYFCLLKQLVFSPRMNIASLKTNKSIITVLRSPHTDKKSREQFKKSEYRKLIKMVASKNLLFLIIKKEFISSKIRMISLLGQQ